MFLGVAEIVVVLVVLVPIAVLVTVLALVLSRRGDGHPGAAHGVVASRLATALFVSMLLVVAPWLAASSGSRATAVIPLVAGALSLAVLWVGEVTWTPRRDTVRRAPLLARTGRVIIPRSWAVALGLCSAVLTGGLVVAGLVADGSGAALSWMRHDEAGSASPFPGWFYGRPQLAGLAVVLALTLIVIRAATNRPVVLGDDPEADLVLRQASVARTLRMALVSVGITLAADLGYAGHAMQAVPGGWWSTAGQAAVVACLVIMIGVTLLAFVPVPAPARGRVSSAVGSPT